MSRGIDALMPRNRNRSFDVPAKKSAYLKNANVVRLATRLTASSVRRRPTFSVEVAGSARTTAMSINVPAMTRPSRRQSHVA